jgi:SAM-dependent methyltransferase
VTAGPTERFTGRVADYARFRPSWPEELLDALPEGALSPSATIADIGSGTGILSRQLARRAGALYCVEPNREMREHSVEYLSDCPNVRIVDGTAEATGLPGSSVDTITAAQAFHWFDRRRAKAEFLRIIRPGGWVVLLWYVRQTTGDPFLEGYEALLHRYAIDYREVDHRNITPGIIAEFFHPAPVSRFESAMTERMDLAGVQGRIASSSYSPPEGHPNHAPLIDEVTELFHRCSRGGMVEFRYTTTADAGMLAPVRTP